jgi:hypothetical protein
MLCYYSVQNFVLSSAVKEGRIRIYKAIILPVVLYGCESWSLIVREEYILRVKNGVFWDVAPCGSCKNRRFGGT